MSEKLVYTKNIKAGDCFVSNLGNRLVVKSARKDGDHILLDVVWCERGGIVSTKQRYHADSFLYIDTSRRKQNLKFLESFKGCV